MSYRIPPNFRNPPPGTVEEDLTSAILAELGDRGLLALIYLRANLATSPRGVFIIDRVRFQDETLLIRSRLSRLLEIIAERFQNDFQLITDPTKRRLEIRWASFTASQKMARRSLADEPGIDHGSTTDQQGNHHGSTVDKPRINPAAELSNVGGENENSKKDQRAPAPARVSFSYKENKKKKKRSDQPELVDLGSETADLKFHGSDPTPTTNGPHRDRGRVIQEITPGDIPTIEAVSRGDI